MSNALMSILRFPWRISTSFTTLRQISSGKGTILCSGDLARPQNASENDNINQDLVSAKSAKKLLQMVDHYTNMDEKQSLLALKSLFILQKKGRADLSSKQLIDHPVFEKICKNIKKYAGVIEVNDTVDALKILSLTGVSSTSTITQVLLQIIRSNVNSLNIPHILYLDPVLYKFEKTPLVQALRIALPMVLEINVKTKLNCTNPAQMADCLFFAQRHKLSEDTIDFIFSALESYSGEFDGRTAASLLVSISFQPRNDRFRGLVKKAATDLMVNIDNVSFRKIDRVLYRLAHKYTKYYAFYYQEVLFDTCANYIVDNNLGFYVAIEVSRNLARLRHFHKPLADYISICIYKNPSFEKTPTDIYSIVVFLALTDYRPVHWDNLKQWISSAKNLAAENHKIIIWIRFASSLCLLDIYKIDVLARALKEEYVEHILKKIFRSNFENYFLIWQCLTTYKPDLVQLLPSANLDPKNLVKCLKKEEFPLEGALQRALGGEQFLLTDLYSKLGVQIDHAIIFSDNSPVPFETKVEYVEGIKLENPSQQLVLICVGDEMDYTINTKTLRAIPAKTFSILEETLKCNVIAINVDSWNGLPEPERISYLLERIKQKLNLDINTLKCSL